MTPEEWGETPDRDVSGEVDEVAGVPSGEPVRRRRVGRGPDKSQAAADEAESVTTAVSSTELSARPARPADSSSRRPPDARFYVTARWVELNDVDAPWWTRGQGVGLRLRLRELLDIAHARNEGATLDRAVSGLREEARVALLRDSRFLKNRRTEIAEQLETALAVEKSEPLPPYGLNYSTIDAAFRELDDPRLRTAIVDELCARAEDADDYRRLQALDEYVELLNAELAYDGHSAQWRHDVAARAMTGAESGADLSEAITSAIATESATWPRTIRFIVPVHERKPAEGDAVSQLLDEEDVRARLQSYLGGVPEDTGFQLLDSAFEFEIPNAADAPAAVHRANEWLEQELSLYRLQGGELEPADAWLAVHPDGNSSIEARPRPLSVLPEGMKRLATFLSKEPRGREPQDLLLADAILQLAQARRTASGAALSDLWTVIEAVFAGAANEPGYIAGEVMAELLEYLYPLALLEWMAGRLARLGVDQPAGTNAASWALARFDKKPGPTFAVSEGDADPLLYARARSFGHWSANRRDNSPSERMAEELRAVSLRCSRVAARAYLVRNFHVHRAQPNRATALAVTLPIFAEIVRAALSYIARTDESAKAPITTAKLRLMRIRQVAWAFQTAREFGGGPLRDALGDDLKS